MNKKDLAIDLRREYGFSWKDANGIIDTVLGSIRSGLRSGDKVSLHTFGTFSVKEFSTRKYRDIRTGRIQIKGITNKVKFNPSRYILKP
ncbi:MAG: HU family DNA-binding protein [Candidatus Aadella gelida]|nr:HU family DNA-binding protein [Candidatus Aadella gelida]